MQTSNQTLDIGFKITHQGLIDLEINSSVTILFWLQIFFILKKNKRNDTLIETLPFFMLYSTAGRGGK